MGKSFIVLIFGILMFNFCYANSSVGGSHYVRAHTTKKGKYVKAHRATNPNHSKADNWSTKGNVNPYTGKKGRKNP